jgi:cytochrome P450
LNDLDRFVTHDMHEVWRLLRAEAPAFWSEGTDAYPGFWSITKYDDVLAISRDPEGFRSSAGIMLTTDPKNMPSYSGRSMISIDPPRHARLRRLVSRGFTPRMVATLEPRVRETAAAIIDAVAPRGRCDFVVDVAARLPLAVICALMGVAREHWDKMFELTNRQLGPDDPEYQTVPGDSMATKQQATRDILAHFAGLLTERRRERQNDLVSALSDAEVDEEPLSDEEILYFCQLLILAGNETTRNATSGGMLTLIEHPNQRALLREDRSLLPAAVEEILRWVSPVLHMARMATRDVEIRGQRIQAGERVVMWYPSANRDEDIFPKPDEFDAQRTPNEHLAFGIGEHFCLGAGLARLELRVMFDELLQHLPDIELDGPVERLRSNFLGGIKHMPVRFAAHRRP